MVEKITNDSFLAEVKLINAGKGTAGQKGFYIDGQESAILPRASTNKNQTIENLTEWAPFKNFLRYGELITRGIKLTEAFALAGLGTSFYAKGGAGYYIKLITSPVGSVLLLQKGLKYWNYKGDTDDHKIVCFFKKACPKGLLILGINNLAFWGVKTFNAPLAASTIQSWSVHGGRLGKFMSGLAFGLMISRASHSFYTVKTYRKRQDECPIRFKLEMDKRRASGFADLMDGVKYGGDAWGGLAPDSAQPLIEVISRATAFMKSSSEVLDKWVDSTPK